LLVLAFAAGAFLVAAALVVFVALAALGAALGAALVVALVAVFFAAGAFFVVALVALVALVVFLASAGEPSFFAVFFSAAGLALALASFTVPEGPMNRSVSNAKRTMYEIDTATRWHARETVQLR